MRMKTAALIPLRTAPAPRLAAAVAELPDTGADELDKLFDLAATDRRLADFAWRANDVRVLLIEGARPEDIFLDPLRGSLIDLARERPWDPLPTLAFAESCAGCGRKLPTRRAIASSWLLLDDRPPPRQIIADLCARCTGQHRQGSSPRAALIREIWRRETQRREAQHAA